MEQAFRSPRRLALVLGISLLLAVGAPRFIPPPRAQAQDVTDLGSAVELKAAALAYTYGAAPDVRVVRAEILRVAQGYASVLLVPAAGTTDPALVVLQRVNDQWVGVAGPGTSFPPDTLGDIPPAVVDRTSLYTADSAQQLLSAVADSRSAYQGGGLTFQYPAAAGVHADGMVTRIGGPVLRDGPVGGPSYLVALTPLGITPGVPLDEWGFDRMVGEIATRRAMGGPAATYLPLAAASLHSGANDVFQIDWFAGDATLRELYVARKGGGAVTEVDTRVYTVESTPAQSQANAAVALLLATLRFGSTPSTGSQALLFIDPYLGYSLLYPASWTVRALEGVGTGIDSPRGGASDAGARITVLPLAAATVDQAVALAFPAGVRVQDDAPATVGVLPARRITTAAGNAGSAVDEFLQLPSGWVLDIHINGSADLARIILQTLIPFAPGD